MRIYIMRHGFAGDYMGKEGKDPSNVNRALQPDGIDAVTAIAEWMADPARNMVPNAIYASPIKRAQQTAKIMSDTFGIRVITDPTLEISKPAEMLIKKIAADKSITRPLLIAHRDNLEPALRRLNGMSDDEIDPIAMAELRALKVDRDDATWTEKTRVLPSDLGCIDYY
jgi:phosphohistidine phosphatase SixA